MKLYLARVNAQDGSESSVQVFATAKERREFIAEEHRLGACVEIDKHTCEFPATKEGIVAFFNRHAWHWQ
jgi:hypothetical protein